MNNTYDVLIIGGGAAGLFCASELKALNPSASVAILEKQQRAGKKLLATGNGRCNLTNLETSAMMYHGSFKYAVKDLLNIYTPAVIIEKFENMGLLTISDNENRVYPLSKQASSVLDILRLSLRKKNIDLFTDREVTDIRKSKGIFTVRAKEESFFARHLVIATGSKATPSLGSDSKMLDILKKAGHSITPLAPALCPINTVSPYLKSLKGIRTTGKVSLIHNKKILKEEFGEIQFTETALSGICIFNLSGLANTRDNLKISVSLLPEYSQEEIFTLLNKKCKLLPANSVAEELFSGLFHKMIGVALLKECGVSPSAEIKSISQEKLQNIANRINNWIFEIQPSADFSKAQVASGGVYGKEIDSKTMESLIVNNLYLIGEIIDIYGDCGGFNLHFAFMSALAAAKRISELC